MTHIVPLTNDDIRLVLNSWNSIRGDISAVGIAIFMKMFEMYPEYHLLFKKFNHIPLKDLPTNKVFISHATIVAEALDEAIMNLCNMDTAKNSLMKIGKNHSDKNMKESHFIHCNDATMIVIKQTLKEKFSKDEEEAWRKVLIIAAQLIVQGMNTT